MIQADVKGRTGWIRFTRADKLNAFTVEMVDAVAAKLAAWEQDPNVVAVIVEGEGKAFCAGGDIRAIRDKATTAGIAAAVDVFRREYRLVAAIARFSKPYVALIDGITMGSGVGLSVHGTAQVATPKTVWAMPETAIGFFPDVGATAVLPQLAQPGLGNWLGLTGSLLKGADAVRAGVASHWCEDAVFEALRSDLAGVESGHEVSAVLDHHCASVPEDAAWHSLLAAVAASFDRQSLQDVVAALGDIPSGVDAQWAKVQAKSLEQRSPTGLALTWLLFEQGQRLDVFGALAQEFRAVQHLLEGTEFYEGIRAMLVDKDRTPRWQPATLATIDWDQLSEYLEPAPYGELTAPK